MPQNYKVISYTVAHKPEDKYDIAWSETRYKIVDLVSGKVLDDAQGYGYRTAEKAHKAWAYKNRTPEQISKANKDKAAVKKWCKENKSMVKMLEQFAFEIAKGSWGPDDKFNGKFVEDCCRKNGVELPFSGNTLIKYW